MSYLRKCIAALGAALIMVSGACAEPNGGARTGIAERQNDIDEPMAQMKLSVTLNMLRRITAEGQRAFTDPYYFSRLNDFMADTQNPILTPYDNYADTDSGRAAQKIALAYNAYYGGKNPDGLYMQLYDILNLFISEDTYLCYFKLDKMRECFKERGPQWMAILEEIQQADDRFGDLVDTISSVDPESLYSPLPRLRSMSKNFPCNFMFESALNDAGVLNVARFQGERLVENPQYYNLLTTLDNYNKQGEEWIPKGTGIYLELSNMLNRIEETYNSSAAAVSKMPEIGYFHDIIDQQGIMIRNMRQTVETMGANLKYLQDSSELAYHLMTPGAGKRPSLFADAREFRTVYKMVIRKGMVHTWNVMARKHDSKMQKYMRTDRYANKPDRSVSPHSWVKMEEPE